MRPTEASSSVDFRQFNGHTQVNATDLRSLRYPSEDQLVKLGLSAGDWSRDAIDRAMTSVLGAPAVGGG